jgi:hypothetical protein
VDTGIGWDGELIGNPMIQGEEKRLLDYHRGRMIIALWVPRRSGPLESEVLRLRVPYEQSLVLELHWMRAGALLWS